MATVVLQYAGAALGTLVGGPIGGVIGRAVGAVAGNIVDQRLFGSGARRIEGPRLNDLRVLASEEGAAIPIVYGRMRIAGQVIWATNLEEVVETSTEKQSSKAGGPKTKITEYSYFGNFAVGLCEGEIDYIGRCWADGKEIDLASITHRIHRGSETQPPDSLITSIEGAANTPAYRGLAYIVFERMPLADFGNRIPQLAFEVYRHGNSAASLVRSLTIIPGSTEFGYDSKIVTRETADGVTESENAHVSAERTDWDISIDEMQGLCRNLGAASLVVAWFGTDLRCGACEVKPGVEYAAKATEPETWRVNGVTRAAAHVVSQVNGGPAYGGTPSDASVVRAIQDLKARGLKTVFYPFIMMDIAPDNALPDPYGGAAQAPYPWRGRITATAAPKTAAVATQLSAFVGTAQASQFAISGDSVTYSGPAEWSYRRMVLHYARLCAAAGGVDAFLIGSELRGLTTLRSSQSAFPFVTALVALAHDVKAILPAAKISYAADWSEYFGHQPGDGTGDVYFHLDPLWSSPAIDFIGIDNYMPLSDWRDARSHADFNSGAKSLYRLDYLKANIAGGEGHDWFYANAAARNNQTRTAISDTAHGKPWVFRYKDLKSWWSNQHYNRPGGAESSTPTGWAPQSKPIWFTEAGCPAVDKGTNAPNLFIDPKSSESFLPPFSGGHRDDLIQNRYLRAVQEYWNASGAHNPVSPVYGGRMLDPARIFFWTWDARPFPAFPSLTKTWSDGPNYDRGHWLTGRLASVDLADLITALAARFGFTDVDVADVEGLVDGFILDRPMSAREALEALLQAFATDIFEANGKLTFRTRKVADETALTADMIVDAEGEPLQSVTRAQETELPRAVTIAFSDSGRDYRAAAVRQSRIASSSAHEAVISLPAACNPYLAQTRADIMLEEFWAARETIALSLPVSAAHIEPGDVLVSGTRRWRVTAITDGIARKIEAVAYAPDLYLPPPSASRIGGGTATPVFGKPAITMMDLPLVTASSTSAPWMAAFAKPWPGTLAVYRKTGDASFAFNRLIEARATMGTTRNPLPQGLTDRIDFTHALDIELSHGALASISTGELLGGANTAVIGDAATGFEIIQFQFAELIAANQYRLRGLVRAQAGSLAEMLSTRPAGQSFILLNAAVVQPSLASAEQGLAQTWRIGPATRDIAHTSYREMSFDPELKPLRPLAPVHMRARRDVSGITISWIRRTRINGDSWELAEVPLGEESEIYTLDILDGAAVKRSYQSTMPTQLYSTADIIADFGSVPTAVAVRVAQVSAAYGPGTFTHRIINV